jgi:hypothetical protein
MWGLSIPLAHSETHALLIGVSGYPSLPESRRLRGPANDVQLMRAVLLRNGVAPDRITVLADSVAQSQSPPSKTAILDELRVLARRARSQDWVVVYLSGHGSQQPQADGPQAYREPDGLDEIFLPYDVGRWDGRIGRVTGALVDDEIGAALFAFTRKGVHVWAIFDTCHAGDMAKSTNAAAETGAVTRFVSPRQLGVPADLLAHATHHTRVGLASRTSAQLPARSDGSLIAFYASHADEPAAEEPLPDPFASPNRAPRRYFGLFTYVLAQRLLTWHGSFRALAQQVSDGYKARPYPVPLFEGDLDRIPNIFGTP